MLVVIDTFEEAEFLGTDVAGPFSQFLLELARMLPEVRLVLSGRTLPAEFVALAFPDLASELGSGTFDEARIVAGVPLPYRPVNLGLLSQHSARDLLQGLVMTAGLAALPDGDLDDVIGVVTRNPMCLRLAARILEREGTAQLVASRTTFLTRLRAEKIQALLYGRILSHLHADDVRAVAYPGLVVRRIAPDVIRDVLAEPCGLRLTAGHDEHAIFAALGKEVALVQADPEDGSLRHRADVRRAMLEDLTDHVPADVVEQIDRRAVQFYRKPARSHRPRRGDLSPAAAPRARGDPGRTLAARSPRLPEERRRGGTGPAAALAGRQARRHPRPSRPAGREPGRVGGTGGPERRAVPAIGRAGPGPAGPRRADHPAAPEQALLPGG